MGRYPLPVRVLSIKNNTDLVNLVLLLLLYVIVLFTISLGVNIKRDFRFACRQLFER